MSVVVVDPPEGPIISLEMAKSHLRVDHDDDDELIASLVAAAMKHVDGPDGWLGRALLTQTLEARFSAFCDELSLPYPPIVEVESVMYDDSDGVEQTVDADLYRVVGLPRLPRLEIVYGESWPTSRDQSEAIRVRYIAGYGDEPDDVPEPIRHGLLLLVGHLYEHREEVIVGTSAVAMPAASEALLMPYRIWGG